MDETTEIGYWIGEQTKTSGEYRETDCPELTVRVRSGYNDDSLHLYKFVSRFGEEYFITDAAVLMRIENLLDAGNMDNLSYFLYNFIIAKFGIKDFLNSIDNTLIQQREAVFQEGQESIREGMRSLLNL